MGHPNNGDTRRGSLAPLGGLRRHSAGTGAFRRGPPPLGRRRHHSASATAPPRPTQLAEAGVLRSAGLMRSGVQPVYIQMPNHISEAAWPAGEQDARMAWQTCLPPFRDNWETYTVAYM